MLIFRKCVVSSVAMIVMGVMCLATRKA